MTSNSHKLKTGVHSCLYPAQLLFFTSAIITLSIMNIYHGTIEIKRPVILIAALLFAFLSHQKSCRLPVISKMIILYIIEMSFNQLTERYLRVQSISIRLSLIVIVPIAVSYVFFIFQNPRCLSLITNILFTSWSFVFAGIILQMLFLWMLLSSIYGYGYGHDYAVLANMCLYFLVFIFSWQQLENIYLNKIVGSVLAVFIIIMTVRGH